MITKGSIKHLTLEDKIEGEKLKEKTRIPTVFTGVSVGAPISLDDVYSIDSSGSHPVIGTISSEGTWTLSSSTIGTHTISGGTITMSSGYIVSHTFHSTPFWEPDEDALQLASLFEKLV